MKLILLLLLPFACFAQADTTHNIIVDSTIKLTAPSLLTEMSQEHWVFKYHQTKRPALVLTDKDLEVNLIVNLTNQSANDDMLEDYKNAHVKNLQKNRTDVQFLQDTVIKLNGRKAGIIKFTSQAIDTKIFNYYFFIVAKGKIVFIIFNCIEKLRISWQKTADEIMTSIKPV